MNPSVSAGEMHRLLKAENWSFLGGLWQKRKAGAGAGGICVQGASPKSTQVGKRAAED